MSLNIKRILVPIDFSDYSIAALRYSSEMAHMYKAKMYLVYVLEPAMYPPDLGLGQITLPPVPLEFDTRAKDELTALAAKYIDGDIDVTIEVKVGKPFVEIIQMAKDEDIDLVIISTHGSSGVEHMLFGSTAEKVVRKAPCPVLTIREPIKGFDYKETINRLRSE